MNYDPRLLFLMRRLIEVHQQHFFNQNIRILDIGCADGKFMNIVEKHLPNLDRIDGVDVPSNWFDKEKIHSRGTIYVQSLEKSIGEIPLGFYHVVTFWEVLEHIEDIYSFLRNIRKLMVPGGVLLMTTPNLFSLSRFIKRQNWIGIAEKDHKYLFDKLSLTMVLSRSGFPETKVSGYFFPSIGKSLDIFNKLLAHSPGGGMLFAKSINVLNIS